MNWTNEEVTLGIKKCVTVEKDNLVLFLRFLIEVERRDLFLEQGASSVQDYCERLLGLCHGTALKRVWVARAAARFPVILDYLSEGKLHLTAVSLLVKHLTEENHLTLLMAAVGKTENELKWMLSSLFPETLPPDWNLNGREKIIPFDGERAKFILVVDQEFVNQLNRAKEIHKHEFPDGNSLGILKKALSKDLYTNDPKEKAKRARPSQSRKHSGRKILRGIEYKKREEAGHQCEQTSPDGVRCAEKGGLELDHQIPYGMGGRSDDESTIALLCFAHNRWKGRVDFGKDYRKPPPN